MSSVPTLPRFLRSLWRADPTGMKELMRRAAIAFCRSVLRCTSQPYCVRDGTVVVFAPHQDDETLGCGALIARRRNEGLPVHVVFVTDGSASHPGHPRLAPAALAALRQREAREVLAVLGVESGAIHFLNEPDGTLESISTARRSTLVARIAGLLDQTRPTEIFLPCSPDGSSEHDATFEFVAEGLQRAGVRPAIWQYPVWAWWNPVLILEKMVFARSCHRVAGEDFTAIKQAALARYRSQIEPLPPQTVPALPHGLVTIFRSDIEYFFPFQLPEAKTRTLAESPRAMI